MIRRHTTKFSDHSHRPTILHNESIIALVSNPICENFFSQGYADAVFKNNSSVYFPANFILVQKPTFRVSFMISLIFIRILLGKIQNIFLPILQFNIRFNY